MAITPLPSAPQITDDTATFNSKAFAWVDSINDFTTEANALAVEVDADKTTATGAASTATTKASEASASADLAEDWATKTDAYVATTENSAKSWAVGGTDTGIPSGGSAKDWATKTDGAVAGGEFSAKKYAQDSSDSADASAASAVEAAGLVENYQGALAIDPTLNKDGDPLVAGDWYVNTGSGLIRAYTGSAWVTSVNVTAGVTSFNAGTTGLTPNTDTQGAVTLAGTLSVANGGTGATTLTGIVKGNGTGAFTAVTAPTGAIVGTTDTQTLTNKTLTDPAIIGTVLEDVFTITDGAAFEIDPSNGSIQLITLGANRTPKATNFAAGEAITLMVDDGTAYAITWTDTTFGPSGVIWETDAGVAPTLSTTGYTTIILWKVASQVYGARVGNA